MIDPLLLKKILINSTIHLLDCRDIKRIEDEKIKLTPTYNPKISTTPIN